MLYQPENQFLTQTMKEQRLFIKSGLRLMIKMIINLIIQNTATFRIYFIMKENHLVHIAEQVPVNGIQ